MLVIFGAYFIFNLILAVIMGSFTKFESQEIMEKLKEDEDLMNALKHDDQAKSAEESEIINTRRK